MAERYKAPKNLSDDENADKAQEKYSFDDLDKEVGLGDILKEKDSLFMALVKKITFAVIILIVSAIVFFASFTIGKMMFMTDQSELTTEGIPSENIIEATAPDTVQTANGQETSISSGPPPQGAGVTGYQKAPARDDTGINLPANAEPVKVTETPKPEPVKAKAVIKLTEKLAAAPIKPIAEKAVAVKSVPAPVKPIVTAPTAVVKQPIVKQSVAKVVPKPAEITIVAKPEPIPVKPAVTVQPVAATPVVEPSMMIVAGTFSKVENVDIVKTKLTGLGLSPSVTEVSRDGKTLLRVIAGTFPASVAKKQVAALRAKGIECFAAPAK